MDAFRIGDTTILSTKEEGVTKYALDDMSVLRIYKIKVESLPGFFTNVYLILDNEAILVDVGSHVPKVMDDLKKGFDIINTNFKEDVHIEDVSNVIITHGHGDHFGGLSHRELSGKKVYVHPLDGSHISGYSEFYHGWMRSDDELAEEAGLSRNVDLSDMWEIWKPAIFADRLAEVDLTYVEDGQKILNGYEVIHTPGHSPGHISLKVGPFLLLGDHVLSSTTPHQIPSNVEAGAGLKVYLASLRKVANLGNALGLAGHEREIYYMEERVRQIEAFHHKRLSELVELCRTEHNLGQLTDEYYRRYPDLIKASSIYDLIDSDKISAFEEIKAHVEYLLEDNRLVLSSVDGGVPRYLSA